VGEHALEYITYSYYAKAKFFVTTEPLVVALQRAVHAVHAALEHELAAHGLTPAELNLLAAFGDHPERRLADLARATAQRRSTLTGVVDRLERRGLVRRGPDAADRRAFVLALTADGRRVATAVAAALAGVDARVAGALEPGDLAACRRVLAALAAAPPV
jgi:DNA-binding MarR family transcriptional regulator